MRTVIKILIVLALVMAMFACSSKSITGSKWYKGYRFRDECGTLVDVNPMKDNNWKTRYSLFK